MTSRLGFMRWLITKTKTVGPAVSPALAMVGTPRCGVRERRSAPSYRCYRLATFGNSDGIMCWRQRKAKRQFQNQWSTAQTPFPQSLHRSPIKNIVAGPFKNFYPRHNAVLSHMNLIDTLALLVRPWNRARISGNRTFLYHSSP